MKKLVPFLLVVLLLSGCSTWSKTKEVEKDVEIEVEKEVTKGDDLNYKTTESGLKYAILEIGDGVQAKAGDFVSVHYRGTLLDGTQFDSSYDRGKPIEFELGIGRVIKGWDEGIALLHVGDKGRFEIPSELAYGARATGSIPANSTLIFDVELVKVTPAPVIEPFNTDGKVAATTDSGLKFTLVEEGIGKKAAPGYTVTVHYTGYLEDGSIFDSSVKRNQPFKFDLGMGNVIAGWEEGVALMRVGDKAHLEIPYQLAYGEDGFPGVIPPKATLIFDVELLDVK